MENYKITAEDKEIFDRDGYWVSPKLLSDQEIDDLRTQQERIWQGDYDGDGYPMFDNGPHTDPGRLRKVDNGWWVNDCVRKTVTDPLIGKIAADLLDVDSIRLWHDQVINKPGLDGKSSNKGNVGWHQDYGYWQSADTTNMITAWIALQDTDLSNGGMLTILGSHKWSLVKDSNTFFEQDLDVLRQKYQANHVDWIEEPCIMKAGQVSFHHSLTFHGSGPNLSMEPRIAIVAHLMPGDTGFRAGVQKHDNIRLLGPRPYHGQKFDNEFFPLLYSRSTEA